MAAHEIRPGQVYVACDPRDGGRRIRVEAVRQGGLRGVEVGRWNIHEQTNAVMAVVEPDRARLRAEMDRCTDLNRQLVKDVRAAERRAEAAETALARVRALHQPDQYGGCTICDPDNCGCVGGGDYPCDTIRALDTPKEPTR